MNLNVVMPSVIHMVDVGAPAPREEAIEIDVDPTEFPHRSS
jgi:hypothetical protein